MKAIRLEFVGDIPLLSRKIARYVLSHIYQKRIFTVCEKPIERRSANIPTAVNQINFRKLERLDNKAFLVLKEINPYLSRNVFFADAAAGHECFIGENADGEVVFYVWARRFRDRSAKNAKRYIYPIPEKSEVHFFSATTKKNYRRKHIYSRGIAFLEEFFGQFGYHKISCTVQRSNYPAVCALMKNNFLITGKQLKVVSLLGFDITLRN